MGSSEDGPAASATEKLAVPEEQEKSEGKNEGKPAQNASLGNYFRALSYATGKDRLVLAVALISAIASGVVCYYRAALEKT
jgi:hypothetical protein